MCGRFFRLQPREELARAFSARVTVAEAPPRYNVAPGQGVLVVRYNPVEQERTLDELAWGLIPYFAKDRKTAWKCINARAETVDSKASYRAAFAKRRCIVVADGFFEWKAHGRLKTPYAIALADRHTFGMAGLWENWKDPDSGEWLRTCTVITTPANSLIESIHDRMPAILNGEDHARWLGQEPATPDALKSLLRPFDASKMQMWPVSRRVNSPHNEDAGMLALANDVQHALRFDES